MKANRIALSAALLATTSLVPAGTAWAQDANQGDQQTQTSDVITVRYQYVPETKRVTSEVASVISAEDFQITGDSDIASALGRVTPPSVRPSSFPVPPILSTKLIPYIVIRLLSVRYSTATGDYRAVEHRTDRGLPLRRDVPTADVGAFSRPRPSAFRTIVCRTARRPPPSSLDHSTVIRLILLPGRSDGLRMQAVVLAAGKGTRLRPLTDDKPKVLVEVDGTPLIEDVFDNLIACGATELVVVVGYKKEQIIDRYGDAYEGVPITYAHQREQLGLAHAILQAEPHVDDDFMLMLGDNVFRGNLADVVNRQREERADAAFLVEEVPYEEASRYGVLDTNEYGEVVEVVEKPDDPPSNLVMTGFYTFTPAIFHACHLVQPSDRGEYELPDAIDLLIQSGRTIDAIRLDGWRIDVGYPEDRDRAEERLNDQDDDGETTEDDDVDEAIVDD